MDKSDRVRHTDKFGKDFPRRLSCPNTDKIPSMCTSVDEEKTSQNQTLKTSTEFSSLKDAQRQRFQSTYIKKPGLFALRPSRSVTLFHEDFNGVHKLKRQPPSTLNDWKNEAEIIADFPMNERHASFQVVSDVIGLVSKFNAKTKNQGLRRRSTGETLDSKLWSLRRNSVEERRLQQTVCKLDKQSLADMLEFKHKINEVFKDYHKTLQRSPTADEWLLLNKSRASIKQQQERRDITRRYSRHVRHFRAPPTLQKDVSKIRLRAIMEARLLPKQDTDSSDDDDLVSEMGSMKISRRHTFPNDLLPAGLPHLRKYNSPTMHLKIENSLVPLCHKNAS